MSTNRIEFISAYCDSWCERCPFTDRCSAFAIRTAIGMCGGNVEAGVELALGGPHRTETLADLPLPSPEEDAAFEREYEARRARVDAAPISDAARAYAILAHRWMIESADIVARVTDPIVHHALDVIAWDHILIGAKLHRALHGRDQYQSNDPLADDHDPVQNDWNGSAKVALISLERSEAAWRVVASCTSGEMPLMMADQLAQLLAEVEHEFPDARRFVRPGFDELPAI